MFIQLRLLFLLLLFQLSCVSANRYGAYCATDSDCDQHQKCSGGNCRCNKEERRFWTGKICAICAAEYMVTIDRCYKSFSDLKTWDAARNHCRAQYADLFSWRDNSDEQFIRPVIQVWISTNFFTTWWPQIFSKPQNQPYLSWAGATITSLNPYTVKWVDSAGLKLDRKSKQWCDPTKDAGYLLTLEPTSGSKKGPNGDEREDCVTYNFAGAGTSFLCLADDYCSQKYPYICEMNTASMELANSVHHGIDDGSSSGTGGDIDFEEDPPPPAPTLDITNMNLAQALKDKSGMLSKTNMLILTGVGIFLIVGAIAGYVVLQNKKKEGAVDRNGGVSQGRPSFASSIGSVMED